MTASQTNPILADALAYAALGFAVGPVAADKKPLGDAHGFNDWSNDPKEIRRLFNKYANAQRVGVMPGTAGFIVVDLDVKDGAQGIEWFRRLVDAWGDDHDLLSATHTHITPSGGLHLWFKAGAVVTGQHDDHLTFPDGTDHVGVGVDVRQHDGFVPVPAIEGPNNGYLLADGDNAIESFNAGHAIDAPEWFAQAWPAKNTRTGDFKEREAQVIEYLKRFNAGRFTTGALEATYDDLIDDLGALRSGRHGHAFKIIGKLVTDLRRQPVDAEKVISGTIRALERSRAGEGRDTTLEVHELLTHCVNKEMAKPSLLPFVPTNATLAETTSPVEFQLSAANLELWSEADRPPRPQPSPELFHGPLGQFALEAGEYTEADPVGIYVQALTMFGVAANSNAHFLAGNDRHPAALFTLVIGATSKGAKGTSGQVATELIELIEPGLKNRRFNGFGSGEQLIADLGANAPVSPSSVAGQFAGPQQSDTRMLVFESEFGSLLTIAARQNSIVSQTVRNAWDGKRLQNRTRSGVLVADNYHLGAIGHITADEFRSKLQNSTELANGFINRFLMVWVERTQLLPDGGNVPRAVFERYRSVLQQNLLSARKRSRMQRSAAAGLLWDSVYFEQADDDPPGNLGGAISRASSQTLRLSLATALADGASMIEVDHVEAAAAMWSYCRATAAHIFGESTGNSDADRLLFELRRQGAAGLDFTAQRDLFSRHAGKAAAARDLLERRGLVATFEVPTDGRPGHLSVAIAQQAVRSLTSKLHPQAQELEPFNPTDSVTYEATKATKEVAGSVACVVDVSTKATEPPEDWLF